MALRLVPEMRPRTDQDLELPQVLYTGTTKGYLREKVRATECFEHLSGYVHLSRNASTALGYALQRALFFGRTPVLLVVDTRKLKGDLYHYGEYKTRALNLGSFLPYEFSLDEASQIGKDIYSSLREVEDLLIPASEEYVIRALDEFLSVAP